MCGAGSEFCLHVFFFGKTFTGAQTKIALDGISFARAFSVSILDVFMMYIHRVIFDLWLHFCWRVVRSSIYQGHSVVLQRIVYLFYEIATLLFKFLTFHDCALKGVTKRRLALAKWANTDFLWAKKVVSFGSIHLFNKTISRLITSFFLLISVSPIIKRSLIALCLQIEIQGV